MILKNTAAFVNKRSTFSANSLLRTPRFIGQLGLFTLLLSQFSFAQKKQENIGTEVVNVVKPYTPTISDAFKVKESPVLNDDGNSAKETVKYAILPFPVASTFTPSKGKADGVEKAKQAHLFKNYATFGGGNYGTLNAELYVNQDLDAYDYVAGMFRHHSSQGGIKEAKLDDKFYDTALDIVYGSNTNALSWNVDLGYQNQIYNWYGLPQELNANATVLAATTNAQQSYNTISLGGKIAISEGILKEASVKLNHFSDAFGSSENRFLVKPTLQLDVMDQAITTNVIVDYLGGSFKKGYATPNASKYGFTNFGIEPSFVLQESDWTVHLGIGVFYSLDTQNSNNQFLIYPQITASYHVVDDLMLFYAGAKGDLHQNSYMDFVAENPFLSPTLSILPTDKKYDFYAGLKGKLANTISYNIKGSYANEANKALFRANDFTVNSANEAYAFGNSFQVVYDAVKTVSFYGELKADFSEQVSFGINGTFSSYTTDVEEEAWNLPAMKLNATLDFDITPKWFAGANVFFVGERKDSQTNLDLINIVAPSFTPTTLKSYFDLNAHVGFNYSERLTAFLRANNIANQTYQKGLNYPVQGFQVVLGANYKFDF